MDNKCFVIQRFDGAHYDQLYEQVFKPAIENAGFTAYRVDQDPSASIPIESIEREISSSDACFVELSEDAPNVWFELGYSIACEKPLCLVCSTSREQFPFDVQHRQIIRYPKLPVPTDYEELRQKIVDRLASILKKDVALQQNTEAAKALSVGPTVSGLRSHELLALTIIFQNQFVGESTGWSLKQDMERSGFLAVASSLAIAGLKRMGFVDTQLREDQNGEPYSVYSATPQGEDWLIAHQDELNLHVEKRSPKQTDAYADAGITDDDIPF
jgi:hypothetical protein